MPGPRLRSMRRAPHAGAEPCRLLRASGEGMKEFLSENSTFQLRRLLVATEEILKTRPGYSWRTERWEELEAEAEELKESLAGMTQELSAEALAHDGANKEIEKLKERIAKHRLSCTCDDDSDEPCPRHHLWMREQDLRVKAEVALKELEEKARWSATLALDMARQVKALDARNAELKSEIDKISGALVTEIATRRRIESALAEKEKNK